MMNFFHNMNLIPKNFIVAGIVDTLKSDPEAGAQKVFDMADKFVTDESMTGLLEEIKNAYYTRQNIRMYVKNLIYNTNKSSLNHFLNNLVVKHLLEGIEVRETKGKALGKTIPHSFILNVGSAKRQMAEPDIAKIVSQAKELGIHFIIVAGEAGSHTGFWSVCEKNSDVQFLVISGIKDFGPQAVARLEGLPNVVPLIIPKAHEPADVSHLKGAGLLFGVAEQVSRDNFKDITTDAHVLPYIRQGSRISFYIASLEDNFTSEEMLRVRHRVDNIRQIRPYVTLHLTSPYCQFGGGLCFEETINQRKIKVIFPEVKGELGKKSLKDWF